MNLRRIAFGVVLTLAVLLPYTGFLPGWTPDLATVVALTALSLIGLNLIFGVTGMLALGQTAFVALPGYISGILQARGMPGALAMLAGVIATVVVARLVAEIFIRLPGIYFAIGTLGFAFVVEGLARAFPSITGGASGLVLEPPVALGRNGWYVLSVASLAIGLISYFWLVRGRFKRSLKLVRHDELAAEVLGIGVARLKARTFMIGSAYSAVGGILLAYYVQVLTPESGGVNASLEALAMIIIGGSGTILGPLWGAAALKWLFEISGVARYEQLVYGVSFFFVVLFAPAGIAGVFSSIRAHFRSELSGGRTRETSPITPAIAARLDEDNSERATLSASVAERHGQVCLQVHEVTFYFGGVCAVDHVTLDVHFGEILAVIGPNGAGKSTLFNVISGIENPRDGRLRLQGRNLAGLPIHQRAEIMGRSFQVPRLAGEMTALENVMARLDHLPRQGSESEPVRRRIAAAQLGAFGLGDFAERRVAEISIGYHKLIEIARASIGPPPLLLLDEPAVGLTSEEVEKLSNALKRLKTQGTAILLVEHNIDFVAGIADQVAVMDGGRVIAQGSSAAVFADPAVQAAYLGVLA